MLYEEIKTMFEETNYNVAGFKLTCEYQSTICEICLYKKITADEINLRIIDVKSMEDLKEKVFNILK